MEAGLPFESLSRWVWKIQDIRIIEIRIIHWFAFIYIIARVVKTWREGKTKSLRVLESGTEGGERQGCSPPEADFAALKVCRPPEIWLTSATSRKNERQKSRKN
jgi:hypothetical protein